MKASACDCLVEPYARARSKRLNTEKSGHLTRRVGHVEQIGIIDDDRSKLGKGNVGDCAPRLFVRRWAVAQHIHYLPVLPDENAAGFARRVVATQVEVDPLANAAACPQLTMSSRNTLRQHISRQGAFRVHHGLDHPSERIAIGELVKKIRLRLERRQICHAISGTAGWRGLYCRGRRQRDSRRVRDRDFRRRNEFGFIRSRRRHDFDRWRQILISSFLDPLDLVPHVPMRFGRCFLFRPSFPARLKQRFEVFVQPFGTALGIEPPVRRPHAQDVPSQPSQNLFPDLVAVTGGRRAMIARAVAFDPRQIGTCKVRMPDAEVDAEAGNAHLRHDQPSAPLQLRGDRFLERRIEAADRTAVFRGWRHC